MVAKKYTCIYISAALWKQKSALSKIKKFSILLYTLSKREDKMKQLNALIIGDPFARSGGGTRCFEIVQRYKKYGINPILVIPPFSNEAFRMKELLPKLNMNGVKIVGAEVSLHYAQRKKLLESMNLIGYGGLSLLASNFSGYIANLLRDTKIDFVIGQHELWDVVQTTHQIAEKLAVRSAIVLQLPPFYQNSQKSFELDMLDSLNMFLLSKKHPLFSYYGFLAPPISRKIASFLYSAMIEFTGETTRSAYYKFTISKHLRFIDKIFAVSKSIPFEMGYDWKKNITIIEPGVATDQICEPFSDEEKGDYMLYFARLLPSKGILEVPLIWKAFLEKSSRKLKLYIAGEFGDKKAEKAFNFMISKLGLKDKVEYLGFIERNQLIRTVTNARAVIYPSHFDSNSLVVLECNSIGTPIVTYDIPGIRFNYFTNKNVTMVPDYNVKAMADKLTQIIENRVTFEKIPSMTWDQVAEAETSLVVSELFSK